MVKENFLDSIYKVDSNINENTNKNNGMMTKVWGPPGWMFLHTVTYGYPYEIDHNNHDHIIRKEYMKTFFKSVGNVLPCKYCRESYNNFIKQLPIDNHLNSRKDLVKWLYDIHNKVNDKLGVPKCNIPTISELNKQYEQYRAQCKKTTPTERIENLNKGCVVPMDGKKKKCVIKVVQLNNNNNIFNIVKYFFILLIVCIICFTLYKILTK